ncbi:zinc finger protein 345-like isoform X3 [Eurosta solidaginis]|uniref:zinc finger protein 345-like isoform X3 n=1 Tax=Eurosta solidaginis TaxID=178769 RepID=UPI003530BC75
MDTSDLYIDYLCRTCMIKLKAFRCEGSTEPQHQSIFETIEECDELRIADLLSRTIPQIVEVQLSDELPKKICCKCLHQLIILYRFQKLCVQSDHKMREMVSKKWDDLNMSMMETAIEDEVLPNDADSYPLSSCQPKCTPQNSLLPETETALEGRQEAIESESAQNDEHSLKNEQLLDFCENSQGELNEFMKNDPIEDEENTEISEFIKNEPVEDDEENTEYSDTVHSTTFVAKEEFTTEEQKVIVPYKNIRDKNYQYACDVCGKHLKTKWNLKIHKRIHSDEKPHKCDFCEKRFIQGQNVRHHMRTHTGEKPCKCKYCDRCFTTKKVLNKHLRVHLGDTIHRCKFCPLAFRYASELRLHSITHKDEDPETRERNMAALREEEAKLKVNRDKTIRGKKEEYQYHPYDVCGKHLKTTRDIKKHDRIHSGEKPHKCDFCEKRFNRASALRHHMRTHTGEKPYKCKYCDQCFTTKKILNKHLRVHLGVNIYKCEFCPLAVRLASELRLHSFTHTHEDPETRERNMAALREEEAKLKVNRYKNIRDKNYQYPCDICGKHFKKTWQLNRHKLFHSDEKPHKCDFCEKQFIQAADLNQHMRTHTGEKPYKCKYCYRCFTTTNALNDHLGVHLGNNIHRCKFCPLAFRLASELRLHSTTHRDEDPETRERNMAALREEEAKLKVYR